MEANSSEPEIADYTANWANQLERIDDPDELDILDVQFMVTTDCKVVGVQFTMTIGGPNITVNALQETVYGSWAGDTHKTHYRSDVVRDYANELADMHEQQYGGI
jgi:hypothetical protein